MTLNTPGLPEKQAEKTLNRFCEEMVELVTGELPKDKAIEILLDQVMDLSGMSGQPLADQISKKIMDLADRPPEQRSFSNSMSQMFDGNDAPADGSSRERFTENEKLLLLQG